MGGSSAGAVAAGLYASGLPPEVIRKTVLDHRFRRSFVRRTPWLTHYIRNTFFEPNIGAFKTDGAVSYLESVLGKRDIESLTEPRYMAAVSNLETCRTHFLQSGPLARAMIASCCIPTVFSPTPFHDMLCFDGGVAHEAPIDPWLEEDDIDVIIMHRINHTQGRPPKFFPLNFFHLAAKAHECASEQLLDYRLRLAAMHGKKVIVTTTLHSRPASFSGSEMPRYYAAGEAKAQMLYDSELRDLL